MPGVLTSSSSTTFCASLRGDLSVGKEAAALSEGAEHHVVGEIHAADKTHAETVFRDKAERDAHLRDRKRILADKLFARAVVLNVADAAALDGLKSGDGLEQLLLAAAGDASNAEDLAGICGEGHVVKLQDAVNRCARSGS